MYATSRQCVWTPSEIQITFLQWEWYTTWLKYELLLYGKVNSSVLIGSFLRTASTEMVQAVYFFGFQKPANLFAV